MIDIMEVLRGDMGGKRSKKWGRFRRRGGTACQGAGIEKRMGHLGALNGLGGGFELEIKQGSI